jgi:uncharacterized membrane protein YkoI
MKTLNKTVIAITASGILTGSSLAALADTAKGVPFEGLVVEDLVVMEQIPREVQSGSIAVSGDDEQAFAAQATVSASDAARIAATASGAKVVGVELDEDNGFLVWMAEIIGTDGTTMDLTIDAGNGRLLAAESGSDEGHEKGDKDDKDGEGVLGKLKSWVEGERGTEQEDSD